MTRAARVGIQWCVVLFGLLSLSQPRTASAQVVAGAAAQSTSPATSRLPPYTLTNLQSGARLLLAPDPNAQAVTVAMFYAVGSAREAQDEQGLARLAAEMMFRGSRNVPPGGHAAWIKRHGGDAKMHVSRDYAAYYQTVPLQHLEPVLWLEAERGSRLALSRTNLTKQSTLLTDQAIALGPELIERRLHQLAFQAYFPYEHPLFAPTHNLNQVSLAKLRRFIEQHYRSNNLLIVVVGNFNDDSAQRLVERYFGTIPIGGGRTLPRSKELPRQTSERFNVVVAPRRSTPRVLMGWRIPGAGSDAHPALEANAAILAQGDTSLAYSTLITEKNLSRGLRARTYGYFNADLLTLSFDVAPHSTVDDNQSTLNKLLSRLRRTGPTLQEVQRAKATLKIKRLKELSNIETRALLLGRRTLASPSFPPTLLQLSQEFDALTAREIIDAARNYLKDTQRTTVEAYPTGWARDPGPVLVTRSHTVKRGENLIRIARRYATSAKRIAAQNNIKVNTPIVPGQRLLITVGAGYRPPPKPIFYSVRRGDNLGGIARQHGVKLAPLLRLNRLKRTSRIFPGQQIKIPVGGRKQKSSRSKSRKKAKVITHVVKAGENIIRIAKRYGVQARQLAIDNHLGRKRKIFPGQKLKVEVPLRPKSKSKK